MSLLKVKCLSSTGSLVAVSQQEIDPMTDLTARQAGIVKLSNSVLIMYAHGSIYQPRMNWISNRKVQLYGGINHHSKLKEVVR